MTKKCKACGSTQVRIEIQEGSLLEGNIAEESASVETTFTELANPTCAECEAPREDLTEEDMNEIWSWA